MTDILNNLTEALQAMSLVEVIGVITGIAGVWLAAKQHIGTWLLGLVSVAMYVWIFYDVRLYADMGLQIFYFFTSIYGWYSWRYGGKNHSEIKVSRITKQEFILSAILGVLFTAVLGYFLENFTNADLSYIDSATTAVSLIGYWMMARKKLENWLLWLAVDAVYVGIYYYKDLYLTSFLYFVFLILATKGYIDWKKEYIQSQNAVTPLNAC
ncbi:nicotinamide riboside transporter PnuC [Pontibacter arcticus]|uniref:Nicotinamide riboside transporter PnuC n=1 Tax=Pontibacter arcticus TaxID=2080288 RepID=A0A364RJK2_9BACT|nr:nicotinamide riboside transporter PnuC [Pontibacter arcticus]